VTDDSAWEGDWGDSQVSGIGTVSGIQGFGQNSSDAKDFRFVQDEDMNEQVLF